MAPTPTVVLGAKVWRSREMPRLRKG